MNFPLAPPVGMYSSSVLLKCLPHLQSFALLLLAFILLSLCHSELVTVLTYQVDSKVLEGRDFGLFIFVLPEKWSREVQVHELSITNLYHTR